MFYYQLLCFRVILLKVPHFNSALWIPLREKPHSVSYDIRGKHCFEVVSGAGRGVTCTGQ